MTLWRIFKKRMGKAASPGEWSFRTHIGWHLAIFAAVMLIGVVLALTFTRNLTSNANSLNATLSRVAGSSGEEMKTQLGNMAAEAVALSRSLSLDIGDRLSEAGLTFEDLQHQPNLLEDILDRETDLLMLALERANCSGVFVTLDATLNPSLPGAEHSRAGVYLRRVEPKRIGNPSEMLYLRGFTQFAQKRGMTLQANWDLEFDIAGRDFWALPLAAARENPGLPLVNLYVWSFGSVIPENTDTVLLCSLPLLDAQGQSIGVCGLEMTQASFRHLLPVPTESYAETALIFAPVTLGDLRLSLSLDLENRLLSGSRKIEADLEGASALREAGAPRELDVFEAGSLGFRGAVREISIYPEASVAGGDGFAVAYIISQDDYQGEIRDDILRGAAIIVGMLLLGLVLIIYVSKRLAAPVDTALQTIQTISTGGEDEPAPSLSVGIRDLDELLRLFAAKNPGQTAQIAEMFSDFLSKLETLTPTERAITALYAEGKSIEEVRERMFIAASTLKTHNVHIYKKLDIRSVDELKLYLTLIRRSNSGARLVEILGIQ